MFEFIGIFLLLGVFSGVIAGLFGVGGGLIMVPALYWILPSVLIASGDVIQTDKIMHIAIGTSLSIIVVTSISSAWSHYQKHAVDRVALVRLAPGLLVGAALSALVADQISNHVLRIIFVSFEVMVAVQMFMSVKTQAHRQLPGSMATGLTGGGIGLVSGLVGIGGGTLTVPFLSWCSYDIKKAIGTSAACGLPIALAGMISFMGVGLSQSSAAQGFTGYVYWPAFIGVGMTSVLFAPLGARLAHRLPSVILKKLFSVFLLFVALKMLLS